MAIIIPIHIHSLNFNCNKANSNAFWSFVVLLDGVALKMLPKKPDKGAKRVGIGFVIIKL